MSSTPTGQRRLGRWVHLDGTTNTRDLGELPTIDGGTTVPGRILRSDNLQDLSEDDIAHLVGDLGLTEVIDLRSTAEVLMEGRGPLREVAGVTHRHFGLLPERGEHTDVFAAEDVELPELPADWTESLLPRQVAAHDEDEPGAVRSYLGYLEHRPENVVGALRALAAAEGASIVHCAAGKDRTGVVVAFTLAVAGVPAAEIVADYAQTAEVIEALMGRLAASPTYAQDAFRRQLSDHAPRAETMARVLAVLDERFGGPAGWLSAHGFDAAEQAALRARLRS